MRNRASSDEAAKFRTVSLLWLAGISLLLVPMASLIDVQVARWFSHDPLSRELGDVLDLSLVYAHGSGIFLILVGIILLAPKCRWHVPRLATLAMGSGAVATLTKMFILRPRPNSLKLETATYDYAWIWSFDGTLSQVADFDAGTRAFPSAYLATATALTVGLWVVLPRGRWLFARTLCGHDAAESLLRLALRQRPVRFSRRRLGLVVHLLPPASDGHPLRQNGT